MGLLDSMLGSVLSSEQGGGKQSGAGGLGALLPAVIGMLANNGQGGGLGGLMEKFNQAGMGDVLGSWIGPGQNAPISGADLGAVLGGDTMGDLAAQLGMSQNDAAGQLAQVLPGLIDKLTPHGNAPEGGLGNTGDLFGMLGGLLQQK
jgi:uncharacterized protein YidB (DUF937 family)